MDAPLARLIDQIQTARAAKGALRIRGGGSKDFYGEAPRGDEALLDTRELAGISVYEPSELVITVRAGTALAEVEAALAERGQHLAFEPPRFGEAGTVGGMVSAGLSGPARAAVGGVRDFVLGATMLNGRGELLSFGGQVMKNVAGYDVARLLTGSMGILGVICELSLKVLPLPVAQTTLRFDASEPKALAQLNAWGAQPLPITASAWWAGTLVVRLAGAAAAVSQATRTLGGEVLPDGLAQPFWVGLRDQRDEFFVHAAAGVANGSGALWRVSVPSTAPALALPGEQLIEWGGAQRWWLTAAPANVVRSAAAAVGGHATLFRAEDKSAGVFTPLSPVLARIHRQMKQAFDPDGVFNPGRLYPAL
jgi:glycolate oxidase FAD binding subunit